MSFEKAHGAGWELADSLSSWTVLCSDMQRKVGGKGRRCGGVL